MDKKDLILVTGGGGFIGSNLTDELVRRGYRVRVLLRSGESEKNIENLIKNKKIEVIKGDLLDKQSLKLACKGVKVIFHLAAKADFDSDEYEPYYQTNVVGTKNLLECSGKLKHFIFYSSILAVGLPNTQNLLNELYKGSTSHPYGRSKKEAEKLLLGEHKKRNFPVTIIRPTTVYGPREIAVQYLLFKTIQDRKFFMIGKGDNIMSYVFVKNLIDATIAAAISKKTLGQVYFINDKQPYYFKDIVKEVYKVLEKKKPAFYIPFYVAYTGAAIFKLLCEVLRIKPLIYPSRVKTLVLNYAYSIQKAEKDFGYKPKYDLTQGIKETYQWYRKEGYLR